MNQTIDFTKAEAPELVRWLAELACPSDATNVNGRHVLIGWSAADPHLEEIKRDCAECDGTGLANPWASGEDFCPCEGREPHCEDCNGSGRVPKVVGLEELFEHGLTIVGKYVVGEGYKKDYWGQVGLDVIASGETPLLAALRAVVKAGMQ